MDGIYYCRHILRHWTCNFRCDVASRLAYIADEDLQEAGGYTIINT